MKSADEVKGVPHVRTAGVVICRQRPGIASGVTFMTLEDETGLMNLVVWRDTFEAYSVLAHTRTFLGVEGTVQQQDNVTHVVATQFFEPSGGTGAVLRVHSHDFH